MQFPPEKILNEIMDEIEAAPTSEKMQGILTAMSTELNGRIDETIRHHYWHMWNDMIKEVKALEAKIH